MPKNDYVHAIYIIGIILIIAPLVQGFAFYILQFDRNPILYLSLMSGQFYATALFQTAGLLMILYVAYKRFMEGWRSARTNSDSAK